MARNSKATLEIRLKDMASKGLSKVGMAFKKLGGFIASHKLLFAALGAGVGFLGKKMIDAADKMEQWSISFETMIGNAGLARDLMEEIKVFATETPFELPDVIKGAKGLLAFGIELETVIPNLKNLGDVAAGLGVPIERLILNFGQVKSQAKLTGRELRDFAIAGVPLISELAKNLNVAESEIAELVSRGTIGFAQVEEAFRTMSAEGGKFNNLMKRQMATFTGVVSNLNDQLFQLSAELGEILLPAAKKFVNVLISIVEAFRELSPLIKIVVEDFVTFVALIWDEVIPALQAMTTHVAEHIIPGFAFMKEVAAKVMDAILLKLKLTNAKIEKERQKQRKKERVNTTKHMASLLEMANRFAVGNTVVETKMLLARQKRNEERKKDMVDTLNFISSLSSAKNKQLAAIGKAAAISIATIDMFAGIGKAWALGPLLGPPLAALVAVAGAANIAKISGVALAEGGVVLPSNGGTVATIGEGGRAEAVIPLDEADEELSNIGTTINVNVGTLVGSDGMTELAEIIDKELFELRKNNQTVSFND